MANDNTTPTQDDQKYDGPGKTSSAIKHAALEGAGGAIVGAGVGAGYARIRNETWADGVKKGLVEAKKAANTALEATRDSIDASKLKKFETKVTKAGEQLKTLEEAGSRSVAMKSYAKKGAVVVGALLAVHGIYKGVKKSNEAKSEFEALRVQASDVPAGKDVAAAVNGAGAPPLG